MIALAGCVSVAPHGLSAPDVAAYRIVKIEASTAPGAPLNWPEGELAYLRQAGANPNDPASGALNQTPEGKAFLGRLAAERLRASLQRESAPRFTGPRPARLVATVRALDIPSAARRMIYAGLPVMDADIQLVDAATGRVIANYAGGRDAILAGVGWSGVLLDAAVSQAVTGQMDHADRLMDSFARGFNRWMFGT